jgi:hypothetical protein
MSDRVDRMFDDLRDALTVEPSMGFAPGVRARIAERSLRRRRRQTAAVGLALVAGVAAVFTDLPWRAAEIAPLEPSAVHVAAPPAATSSVLARPNAADVAAPKRRIAATARHEALTAAAAPLVLVPDDQMIALDLLLRARGRVAVASSRAVEAEQWPAIEALPEISPIEIPPLPGTPADPNERKPT